MDTDAARVAAELFAAQAKEEIVFALSENFESAPFGSEKRVNVVWRIKQEDSIRRKFKKGNTHVTLAGMPLINDFIGIRIVVLHAGLIERTMTVARRWAALRELRLIDISNTFSSPGIGGYKSVHLDFEFERPQLVGLQDLHGIEVQITTYLQQFHSQLSHDALYKADRADGYAETAQALKVISDHLAYVDQIVADLFFRK
jgi:ppGpp synthetase/RelA/SpoT-type nucleotidyltranferase